MIKRMNKMYHKLSKKFKQKIKKKIKNKNIMKIKMIIFALNHRHMITKTLIKQQNIYKSMIKI